jgi:2',3'-cyclic-nucleotide 3'-phosphodiesterase
LHYSADVTLSKEQLGKIEELVSQKGIHLHGELDGNEPNANEPLDGWEGGDIWLVHTDKDIKDWKPVATRSLTVS